MVGNIFNLQKYFLNIILKRILNAQKYRHLKFSYTTLNAAPSQQLLLQYKKSQTVTI